MKIEGRTFIISGGASGLGQACAEDICEHGGYVAIFDRNDEDGKAVERKLHPAARFFSVDVTETESIAAAVSGAAEWAKSTSKPLGGVIPAAGVGHPGLILDSKLRPLSLETIDFVLNINLRGTLDLIRQTLPHLAQVPASEPDGERGVIIMVSSVAAFEGQMGQVAYAASKGAVASMTLPLARDLSRRGIRVVTIAPSLFETSMAKLMTDKVRASLQRSMEFPPRAGRPDEFAAIVRQVIENSMLNGAVIRLDGASRMPSRL